MDKNIKLALNDIQIIKNSIEKCKPNASSLCKILNMYGILNLVHFLAVTIIAITFKISTITMYPTIILNMAVYVFLLLYYIKIYKIEKVISNKYYIGFLNIWMVTAILL